MGRRQGAEKVENDSEACALLVARARVKAIRSGTTLESEVERWLTRYVGEPDVDVGGEVDSLWDSDVPIHVSRPSASRAFESHASATPPRPVSSSSRSSGATRSEAYRRLIGVLRDTSDESP